MTVRNDLLRASEVMLVHGLLAERSDPRDWGEPMRSWPWRGVSLAGAVHGSICRQMRLSPRETLGRGVPKARIWAALNQIADVLGEPVTEVFQWGHGKSTAEAVALLTRAANAAALYLPTSSSLSSSSW